MHTLRTNVFLQLPRLLVLDQIALPLEGRARSEEDVLHIAHDGVLPIREPRNSGVMHNAFPGVTRDGAKRDNSVPAAKSSIRIQ